MKGYFRNMSFTSGRRDLGIVVAAKAVSFLGDEVAAVALLLRLQSHGAGAGAIAALLIANLAPIVLLSGVVGRLVDRHDSRALLVSSSLGQAAACSALVYVSGTPAVLALVALLGAGQAVNGATWQALLPSLVEPAQLPRALGFSQAANTFAGIAAPAISGLLVGAYGARVPLLIDAATFIVVTGAAFLMHGRRVPQASADAPMQGGWSIVRRSPLLRTTVAALGLFIVLGSMVNVVEVFLIRSTLHASTVWYGLVGAAYSVGVFGGALLGGRLRAAPTQARSFVAAAALLGAGLVGMGFTPNVGSLLAIALVAGTGNGVLSVCTSALIMGTAAPAERGRVGAVVGGVVSGTQLAAYAASGALAAVLSPREIFVGAGLLGLVVPLTLARAMIRSADATVRPAQPPALVTA
jgi:MFS family permease